MYTNFITSPIAKKLGMAITGLIWYGFLVGHLIGNFLLFKGDGGEAFDTYAEFLENFPLLIPIELFLVAAVALHVYLAISVTADNRRARPVGYQVNRSSGGRSFASSSMAYTGTLTLVFIIVHVATFKFGDRIDGSLYKLVVQTFQQTGYAVWYIIAMLVLGFHLWHAFHSAFQTLSLRSKIIRNVGSVLCIFIATGFALLPIAAYVGIIK
ncbi:MAG: succinate dehydrogenase [Gemmatimonadetes bacterium]|nr:succinate dehydrogenase [Gemmatimonadota bacterium]|tara:strand:- start:46 stop:678 length:633 start_codon:yes stop_codon:yes gene_type:complete